MRIVVELLVAHTRGVVALAEALGQIVTNAVLVETVGGSVICPSERDERPAAQRGEARKDSRSRHS